MSEGHKHYFYGKAILPDREQEYINNLLKKYKNDLVNDELKKKIFDDLQAAKFAGMISIPFKVVMRRDPEGKYPDYIEVILDTKV